MTSVYCDNKVRKKGGSFHYSLRFVSHEQQDALICIQAFYQEILDCLFDCSDVAISRARLQFWRDEIDLAYQHKSAHPVMLALSKTLKYQSLNKKLFFSIINGIESYLDYPLFEKQADVFHFLSQTAGCRELLNLEIIGKFQGSEQYAYQLGAGLEMMHQIRHLKRYLDKGHCFFAQQTLDFFQCKVENFSQQQPPEAVFNFLKSQAEQAKDYLLAAKKIALTHQTTQRFNLIRINLALTLLNELEKSGLAVLQTYVRLNPLRKLWVSYQM